MNITGMPIEALLTLAMEQVENDSTKDLRGMVEKVDQNMQKKEKIRRAQKKLEMYKQGLKDGSNYKMNRYRNELISALRDAGFNHNSEELQSAYGLRSSKPTGNKEQVEERTNNLEDKIKSLESILDADAQSLSDLGQKLQFQLTEANRIFNRSVQTKGEIAKTHNQTANALVRNISA